MVARNIPPAVMRVVGEAGAGISVLWVVMSVFEVLEEEVLENEGGKLGVVQ